MKRITLAILVLATLAFGLVLSGCDGSVDDGGVNGDDFSLVGTWESDFNFTVTFTDLKVTMTYNETGVTAIGDYTFEYERDSFGTTYGDGLEPEKVGTLNIMNLVSPYYTYSYARYLAVFSRSYLSLVFQDGELFTGTQLFIKK